MSPLTLSITISIVLFLICIFLVVSNIVLIIAYISSNKSKDAVYYAVKDRFNYYKEKCKIIGCTEYDKVAYTLLKEIYEDLSKVYFNGIK